MIATDRLKTISLLSLDKTIARPLLEKTEYPWEALPLIENFIAELGKTLPADEYISPKPLVWIHKTAAVADSADITGPAIICANAQLRHSCFIRGSAIIGENCVVGNSTEVKNAIFFDNAQAPHFNYVGDSILGNFAHIGAGVILSNLRLDRKNICLRLDEQKIETGLRKFGAIIGDGAEIGCNSVLNPGTIICRNAAVMPVSNIKGYYCALINKK